MDTSVIYATIRQTVQTVLPGARVVLFGSRARGDEDRYSDYDLLIISPINLAPKEKISWSTQLDKAIVKAAHIPVDLILSSDEEIIQKRELPGHIIRTALREGIML